MLQTGQNTRATSASHVPVQCSNWYIGQSWQDIASLIPSCLPCEAQHGRHALRMTFYFSFFFFNKKKKIRAGI